MDEAAALNAISAISNQTRLRILKSLVKAGANGLTAGEIAQTVGATPSRASFHLASMTDAGLLSSSRQARRITYTLNFSVVGQLIRYLLHDCCQNNPTVRRCCLPGS